MSFSLGSAFFDIGVNFSAFRAGLKTAESLVTNMTSNLGILGGGAGLAINAGMLVGVGGVAALGTAIGSAVNDASKIQEQAANIKSIIPDAQTMGAQGQLVTLTVNNIMDAINKMRGSTILSADDIGKAFYMLNSQLLLHGDVLAQTEGLTNIYAQGAVGASTTLDAFGTTINGVMNGLGQTKAAAGNTAELLAYATQDSNLFFNALKNGAFTGAQLAASLPGVAKAAVQTGQSFATTAAMIAASTKEGGDANINLGQLNQLLSNMSTEKTAKGFASVGLSLVDAQGNFKSMIDIVGELKDKLSGDTLPQQMDVLNKIFGRKQSVNAMHILMDQFSSLSQFYAENTTQTNNLSSAYDTMMGTFQSQTELAKNEIASFLEPIGEQLLPQLTNLAEWFMSKLPDAFAVFNNVWDKLGPMLQEVGTFVHDNLMPPLQTLLTTIGDDFASKGNLFVGTVGAISGALAIIGGGAAVAFGLFVADVAPFFVAIAGIGVAVVNAKKLWDTNWDGIQGKVHTAISAVMTDVSNVASSIVGVFNWLTTGPKTTTESFNRFGKVVVTTHQGMSPLQGAIGDVLVTFKNLHDNISGIVTALYNIGTAVLAAAVALGTFQALIAAGGALSALSGYVTTLAGAFQLLATGEASAATMAGLEAIAAMAEVLPFILIAGAIALVVGGLVLIVLHWNDIYKAMGGSKGILGAIGGAFSDLGSAIQGVIKFLLPLFTPLGKSFSDLGKAAQPLIPLFQFIGAILAAIVLAIITILGGLIGAIAGGLIGLVTGITMIINGVVQVITGIINVIIGIFSVLYDAIQNPKNLGKDFQKIWDGIIQILTGVWNIVAGLFVAVFGTLIGLVVGFVAGIIDTFMHLWDSLVGHSIIPDMINGIIQWFQKLPGEVGTAVGNMVTGVTSTFTTLATKAITWGSNMIGGIVSGITGGAGKVADSVGGVAKKIFNFLGFGSPTEEGPGSTADQWMPNLTNMLVQGLNTGKAEVQAALNAIFAEPSNKSAYTLKANIKAEKEAASDTKEMNALTAELQKLQVRYANSQFDTTKQRDAIHTAMTKLVTRMDTLNGHIHELITTSKLAVDATNQNTNPNSTAKGLKSDVYNLTIHSNARSEDMQANYALLQSLRRN